MRHDQGTRYLPSPSWRVRSPVGESRQQFIAGKTVGYDGRGRRIVKTGSGKSESAALRALRERVREFEAGLMPAANRVTVAQAVEDWLEFERSNVGGKNQ